MRIIAGTHRGRRLLAPVGKGTTRPITDRVKTALFDRLAAAGRVEGAEVLDLFAGTGSMGIECLSRGAEHVTFVERDRTARQRLERNLASIGRAGDARVLGMDALSASLTAALEAREYSLIFLDPPYRMMREPGGERRVYRQLARLADRSSGGAVLRTDKQVVAQPVKRWTGPESHTYGTMTLHLYERGED